MIFWVSRLPKLKSLFSSLSRELVKFFSASIAQKHLFFFLSFSRTVQLSLPYVPVGNIMVSAILILVVFLTSRSFIIVSSFVIAIHPIESILLISLLSHPSLVII